MLARAGGHALEAVGGARTINPGQAAHDSKGRQDPPRVAHVRQLLGPAVETAAGRLALGQPPAEVVPSHMVEPVAWRKARVSPRGASGWCNLEIRVLSRFRGKGAPLPALWLVAVWRHDKGGEGQARRTPIASAATQQKICPPCDSAPGMHPKPATPPVHPRPHYRHPKALHSCDAHKHLPWPACRG